jgi:hypothetical protein
MPCDSTVFFPSILHGYPAFCGKEPQPLFWIGSLTARVKITISGVPERLNFCEVFFKIYVYNLQM